MRSSTNKMTVGHLHDEGQETKATSLTNYDDINTGGHWSSDGKATNGVHVDSTSRICALILVYVYGCTSIRGVVQRKRTTPASDLEYHYVGTWNSN